MRVYIIALLATCACASPPYLDSRYSGVEGGNLYETEAKHIRSSRMVNEVEQSQNSATIGGMTNNSNEFNFNESCKCVLDRIDNNNSAFCDSQKGALNFIKLSDSVYNTLKQVCEDTLSAKPK